MCIATHWPDRRDDCSAELGHGRVQRQAGPFASRTPFTTAQLDTRRNMRHGTGQNDLARTHADAG
jgi:hypothetical protein